MEEEEEKEEEEEEKMKKKKKNPIKDLLSGILKCLEDGYSYIGPSAQISYWILLSTKATGTLVGKFSLNLNHSHLFIIAH